MGGSLWQSHDRWLYLLLFSNPEVQVNFKLSVQDVGVQVDLLQHLECASSAADACVQCDIEYPLFESTPRIDSYFTTESEFPDVAQGTDRSAGTYYPSGNIKAVYTECVYACIQ